jgi:hypothetical protein
MMAAAATGAWWLAAVRFAWQGNATALFMIGEHTPMPEWLERSEPLYRWRGSGGYDGQYFHLLAHAPFAFRQLAPLMDRPRMRCQRILAPLAAWLLAGGRQEWIDKAWLAAMLGWLALGVWSTAMLATRRGAPAWWGLAFLALPASLGSVERMLVDGPLMAAMAALLWLLETGSCKAAWLAAAAAPFLRESGLLFPAAAALVFLARQRIRMAAWAASAGIPFLLWLASIRDLPGGVEFFWSGWFASVAKLLSDGETYAVHARWSPWIHALDLAAFCGFVFACAASLILAVRLLRQRDAQPFTETVAALFAMAALALAHVEPRHAWDSVFSMGRVFAPVYFGLLMRGLETGRTAPALLCLAPAALRAALGFGPVAQRIVQGLAGA